MKNENETKTIGQWFFNIIFTMFLVALVFLLFTISTERGGEPEPTASLNAISYSLNQNAYNLDEMFYTYRLDNFGGVEAKNVVVGCKILNNKNEQVNVASENIGNVASNSTNLYEMMTNNIEYSLYEDGSYFCYVKSCDDCIILWKSIPEFEEYYNA